MIKIFNRTRKKLIKDKSITKYLLYAFGEIILVVLGILIALQINTAKEVKASKKKTTVYLSALNIEVQSNIKLLNAFIETAHADIVEAANTHAKLNSKEALLYNDSILLSVINTRPVFKASLNTSTFSDLINSGTLEFLDDLELKATIFKIDRNSQNIEERFNNAKNVWDEYQLPYQMKYSAVSSYWDSISGVPIAKLPFKRNKAAYIHNSEYADILALRMRMMENYETALINVLEFYNKLTKEIDFYLENQMSM